MNENTLERILDRHLDRL